MVNGSKIMCAGGAILLLLGIAGTGWTFTPVKIYNRPTPLTDYVPQEIGHFDTLYQELAEMDCRGCHGNSVANRMHYSELGLTGFCTPCHAIISTPPYVEVTRDCTTFGCHSGSDLGPKDVAGTPPNGWHHYTQESYVDQCIACHDPGVLDRVVDDAYKPFAMYPPSVVTPSPFDCENCHWEQPVIANTVGWQNGDPQSGNPYYTGGPVGDLSDAGHPSTFDHNDPYTAYSMDGSTPGFWNDYFEYGKKIESNFDTHHMLFNGNVSTDCERCHSVDPDDPSWDPNNQELIRYCETCHDVATLHAIQPHVGTGGVGDPPAVNGWEAVGFHVPDTSNTNTADVAPGSYTQFTANEQCYGCHADDLPTWLPDPPVAQPVITDITPEVGACDAYVTLAGNYFGAVKTVDRGVWIKSTSGGVYSQVPIMSWTDTQIEFQIPCWVYLVGNYKVVVDTETGPPSNIKIFTLKSGASVDSLSPTTGACREIITVSGSDFDAAQDIITGAGGFGVYKVVQVVASAGTYQATAYGSWSPTSFKFRMGDLFEDADFDFIRDLGEPLLKQCEYLALGSYSVYVRSIFYEDTNSSGGYNDGDEIHQITISDPEYFVMENALAVYAVSPRNIERSHYCSGGLLVNGVAKIYGWGFGPSQGTGKVYIGTGPMYSSDTGLELTRLVWSSLLIKVGVDVPPGAKGLNLYIWVEKAGVKTDASYGYPGIHILTTETCP
jgi:hypothetical protein